MRQAQGAREVGRRNDAADAHTQRTCPFVLTVKPGRSNHVSTRETHMVAAADEEPSTLTAGAATPTGRDGAAATAAGAVPPAGRGGGAAFAAVAVAAVNRGQGVAAVAKAVSPAGRNESAAAAGESAPSGLDRSAAAAAGLGGTREAVALPLHGGGAAAAAVVAGKPCRRTAIYITRCSMDILAQRPGLADIGTLFELPPEGKVPVLSTVEFTAQFDCGTTSRQLLRASPQFRDETPWYDAILFLIDRGRGELADTEQADDKCERDCAISPADSVREELYVGEVRAIIRCGEDDYAVVCQMMAVDAVRGCPFSNRECDRISWAVSSNGRHMIRAVPLSKVSRLLHLVPYFQDLAARKGLAAAPAGYRAPLADRLAMNYFVNEFYPWASRGVRGTCDELVPSLKNCVH